MSLENRLTKLEVVSAVVDRSLIWTDRGPDGESLEQAIERKFGDAVPEGLVVIVVEHNGRERAEP